MSERRDRLLKRLPVRQDVGLVLDVSGLYHPPRQRRGMVYFDCPAGGALVASGGLYTPPLGGARIRAVACNGDNGAPGTWRFGLVNAADLSGGSAAVALGQARPSYQDAPLRGIIETWQFFGLGDLSGALAAGTIAYPDVIVNPPFFFAAALTGDNAIAEGFMVVEEFIDGDEGL